MNISSVLVRVLPDQHDAVRQSLASLAGVEVHAEDNIGRLIVTLEDSDVATAADRYVALQDVPGVLSAILIYQYSDDDGSDLPSSSQPNAIKAIPEEVQP
jgi:nitrate reductase NapD